MQSKNLLRLFKSVIDKDKYNRWNELVNMSKSELTNFMKTDEGKSAGLSRDQAKDAGIKSGQESATWILKMLDTDVNELWNDFFTEVELVTRDRKSVV